MPMTADALPERGAARSAPDRLLAVLAAFDHDHPALSDRRVRQALLLATDRAQITERLFAGRQPVAHSSVNPLDPMHDPDVRRLTTMLTALDTDTREQLMSAAGI